MSREATLQRILATGVVAVIRLPDAERLFPVIDAIRAGGVECLEVTMTVPGATGAIRELAARAAAEAPGLVVGAGTVLDAAAAEAVIEAGARFVVSPVLEPEVMRACRERDVAVVPGCFSPTEVLAAWRAGADIVKIFPAGVLGMRYFKDLRGPLPEPRLMPTGGVTIENAGDWIRAGAGAVGIGSDLLDPAAIAQGRYPALTERARRLVDTVRRAREGEA